MEDKESAPSVIAAYRKRQERAERMLVIFWIAVMLVVIGAGYLVFRLLKPGASNPNQVLAATKTATPTVAATQRTAASSPPGPAETVVMATTETPPSTTLPTALSVMTYTVKEGETFLGIAGQLGVGLPTLMALNPQITPEVLRAGEQISIPVSNGTLATVTPATAGFPNTIEYKVVAGDTLAAIAARYGSTVEAIVQENNLASPNQIREGQTLRIPVTEATTPTGLTPVTTASPKP